MKFQHKTRRPNFELQLTTFSLLPLLPGGVPRQQGLPAADGAREGAPDAEDGEGADEVGEEEGGVGVQPGGGVIGRGQAQERHVEPRRGEKEKLCFFEYLRGRCLQVGLGMVSGQPMVCRKTVKTVNIFIDG